MIFTLAWASGEDLVDVYEGKIDSTKHMIHEPMEILGCLLKVIKHTKIPISTKLCCDRDLWNFLRGYGDMIMHPHRIEFRSKSFLPYSLLEMLCACVCVDICEDK